MARVLVRPTEETGESATHAEVRIERWTLEEIVLRVTPREPLRVGLRVLDYPAWRVEVNHKAVMPEHAQTNGEMIVPLSAGTERVTLKFARTPDRKAGIAISMVALLALLALLNAGGVRLLSASP